MPNCDVCIIHAQYYLYIVKWYYPFPKQCYALDLHETAATYHFVYLLICYTIIFCLFVLFCFFTIRLTNNVIIMVCVHARENMTQVVQFFPQLVC